MDPYDFDTGPGLRLRIDDQGPDPAKELNGYPI